MLLPGEGPVFLKDIWRRGSAFVYSVSHLYLLLLCHNVSVISFASVFSIEVCHFEYELS